jgi:hypothetical protein
VAPMARVEFFGFEMSAQWRFDDLASEDFFDEFSG